MNFRANRARRSAFRFLGHAGAVLVAAACSKGPTQGGTPPNSNPQIASISPANLAPGGTAVITGTRFSATPAGNLVTIGGVPATVTASTTTQLTVTVPCAPSGSPAVQVTSDGKVGAAFTHPLQGNRRTLGVGQSVIVTSAAEVGCNELAPAGGPARYVVAVYNTAASPAANVSVRLAGDGIASAALAPSRLPSLTRIGSAPAPLSAEEAAARQADQRHHQLLEKNRAEYARLYARFSGDPRMRPSTSRALADPVPPPATRTFRVSNINSPSICANYFTVSATRVFYDGRIAIYQDNANPITTGHATLGAAMQSYFNRIGEQFNADMEPIIRASFGDVLRRDAVTDNNGVLVALFTNTINTEMPSVAGFVVSCDQFPNDEATGSNTNTASNHGEYFYAYVPTVAETGYNGLTPDNWYRTIRSTFIHETKHVASQAARVANGSGSWEVSWLEEGTARHSEELWARQSVYNVPWKGNTGYGTGADFASLYCDVRPTTAGCLSANDRRPSLNMQRHFGNGGLYEFLGNSTGRSPFGRAEGDGGASFYATSWSLVRYAIDRFAASDAAFLTALTQSAGSGLPNLAGATGVSTDQLMGGWALALYADDYPGLPGTNSDIQFPTWNIPHIYAGLKADFATSYPRTTPIVAEPLAFGSFAAVSVPSLAGGGVKYFELSGTQTAAQMLRLEAADGGAPPMAVRVAIARLQ